MSFFDPATFLDATLDTPTEKRPPLPVGDYTGVIGEVTARAWQGKADPTKSGIAWDVPLLIEVPAELQASMGLPSTITLKDSVMLDLTPDGMIDNGVGRNRRLRLYREAVDLNNAGDKFSARVMQGRTVLVKVSHELWEGQPVERVTSVARLA
jgi:hypothetical protein